MEWDGINRDGVEFGKESTQVNHRGMRRIKLGERPSSFVFYAQRSCK